MESELKMTQNPLQTQVVQTQVVQTQVVQTRVVQTRVEEEEKKLEPILEKAQRIYNGLQEDIQRHLIEEYIKPELKGTHLIKEFDKIIESEECQRLEWRALTDIVEKIINHKGALSQMCEIDTLGFRSVYRQHFIQGKNTFVLFDTPLSSMCAELVMRKWH